VAKASKFSFLKGSPSTADQVSDVVDSVKLYAKQQTLDPLRGAVRWLLFGVVGAVFTGLGLVFLIVGVLRLSQDLLADQLDGAWSFVHYAIASVFALFIVVVALLRIQKKTLAKGGV
jgi:hypothetical protein